MPPGLILKLQPGVPSEALLQSSAWYSWFSRSHAPRGNAGGTLRVPDAERV